MQLYLHSQRFTHNPKKEDASNPSVSIFLGSSSFLNHCDSFGTYSQVTVVLYYTDLAYIGDFLSLRLGLHLKKYEQYKKSKKGLTVDKAVNQPGIPATNKKGSPVTFSPQPKIYTCHTSSTWQYADYSNKWIHCGLLYA